MSSYLVTLKYVLLVAVEPPQVPLKRQQTPNPLAQVPDPLPPSEDYG